jgi:hypothetical protein
MVGGVNHCSLHCRLGKFRGLMIEVKNGVMVDPAHYSLGFGLRDSECRLGDSECRLGESECRFGESECRLGDSGL